MKERQITIKPSCMHDLRMLPKERGAQLWEKIDLLVRDPFPDGKVKKKLRTADDLYRLRVGDHRIFYRFGDDWVSLLGVRRRTERTYANLPDAPATPSLPPDLADDDLDALLAGTAPPPVTSWTFEATPARPLPIVLTAEWLESHGVPVDAFPKLLRCRTEDDLLEAPISQDVVSRVLDALFPPSLQTVQEEPDLVVPSTDHLVRYAEGDLLGFLLQLDADQRRLTSWALDGPTLVKGGAGTGKSTVALHRVKAVLERPGASGRETVLFTTYTNALLEVSRQLLRELLDDDQFDRVRVATVDRIARELVASRRPVARIETESEARKRLHGLRATFRPEADSAFEAKLRSRALDRLSDRYVLEEIEWIIEGRGLTTLDAYLASDRTGRGVAFPERLRHAVWQLYERFAATSPSDRFPVLRKEAYAIAAAGSDVPKWDYVFVDEAQDLSPVALGLMARSARTPAGLFLAADAKQSIYARGGWTSADPSLDFRGRTAILKRNYRSTLAIDRAAFALLESEPGEALEPSESVHDGPMPVLVREAGPETEADWIARFVRQMARHLRLRTSSAAVLAPTNIIGEALAAALEDAGIAARFFSGRELDLGADAVKVITLHSAKGLEFPIVAIAGSREDTHPVPEDFDDDGLYRERMRHHRRLLYVGATRAMRALMLIVPEGTRDEALVSLDTRHWHVEDAR